jgi:hypothetical protein
MQHAWKTEVIYTNETLGRKCEKKTGDAEIPDGFEMR